MSALRNSAVFFATGIAPDFVIKSTKTHLSEVTGRAMSNEEYSTSTVIEEIPDIVIGRLPVYLRTLRLLYYQNTEVTSSQELGELLGISSAQIRKDLSHFGEFGKQGTGYNVAYLCRQLEKILKVDCIWPVVLVGAGYLGHALASYHGFEQRGFRIVGVFDSNADKIGVTLGERTVEPVSAIPAVVHKYRCQIAIIAVPAPAAQAVAEQLIDAGIRSILCYAPITLSMPANIRVEYIDPVISFQHMTFYLEKGCIEE
jgi:redox-sensing transcriptional repressor